MTFTKRNRQAIKVIQLLILSLIILNVSSWSWGADEEKAKNGLQHEENQSITEFYNPPESPPLFESNAPDLFKAGTRMIAGLVILVGVLLVLAAMAKRFWSHGRTRLGNEVSIRIVANRYLGSKNSLSVIDVEGEHLLLGISANGIRLLTKLKGGSKEFQQREKKSSFEKIMQGRLNDE